MHDLSFPFHLGGMADMKGIAVARRTSPAIHKIPGRFCWVTIHIRADVYEDHQIKSQ
jgi:hypothetical protein